MPPLGQLPGRLGPRQSAADALASGEAINNAVVAMQTIAEKIMVVQEIARLQNRLRQAEAILDAQKKMSELFALSQPIAPDAQP